MINELKLLGLNMKYLGTIDSGHFLSGKRVLVTGSLNNATRQVIKKKLIDLGANPVSSASGNTDIVFVGDNASPAKVKKATNAKIVNISSIKDIIQYNE
jgi:DNA ligase (NAD+)